MAKTKTPKKGRPTEYSKMMYKRIQIDLHINEIKAFESLKKKKLKNAITNLEIKSISLKRFVQNAFTKDLQRLAKGL